MYLFVEIGLILLLCSITRFLFLLGGSSDAWVERWLIRKCSDGDLHEIMRPSDSSVDGIYGRPVLFNWFVSLWPERYWLVTGLAINIGSDLCLILLIYLLASVYSPAQSGFGPFTFAGWTALLTGLTPLYHPVTSRLQGCLKTRSAGTLLSLICVGTMWLTLHVHPGWGVLSLLFFLLTLTTSQFGLQIIFFFLLGMSFWAWSLIPIGSLAITYLVLYALSDWVRTFTWWKYGHFAWYYEHQREVSPTKRKNRLQDLFTLPITLVRDPRRAYWDIARTHTVTTLPYLFPVGTIFVTGIGLILLSGGVSGDAWGMGLLAEFSWFMTCTAGGTFLFTSVYPMLFLGEAERYVEPAVPFVTLLFLTSVRQGLLPDVTISVAVLWSLIVILLNVIYCRSGEFRRMLSVQEDEALEELVTFLDGKRGSVLTIPLKYSCRISSRLRSDGLNFLIRGVQHPGGGKEWHDDIRHEENHSYPHERLEEIVDRFEVDYIVVNRKELEDQSILYEILSNVVDERILGTTDLTG